MKALLKVFYQFICSHETNSFEMFEQLTIWSVVSSRLFTIAWSIALKPGDWCTCSTNEVYHLNGKLLNIEIIDQKNKIVHANELVEHFHCYECLTRGPTNV